LVEEVLDELLFERTRSKESVKIGTEEFSYEVATYQQNSTMIARNAYMSSRGEMKISLSEIIYSLV